MEISGSYGPEGEGPVVVLRSTDSEERSVA